MIHEKVQNVYCAVDPIGKDQLAEHLVKTASVKRFAWWSATKSGRQAIKEHNLVAFFTKKDALKEVEDRLKIFKKASKLIEAEAIATKAASMDDVQELFPRDPSGRTQRHGENDRPEKDTSWKFETPATIVKSLKDKIKALEGYLKTEETQNASNCQFYLLAISSLNELLALLEAGTQRDFKLAVMKFYSYANFIYAEVPLDVSKFLTGGGGYPKLSNYYYHEVEKKEDKRFQDVK